MRELLPNPAPSPATPPAPGAPGAPTGVGRVFAGMTRRSLVVLGLTSLLSGALLVLLLVRLIAAGQMVAATPPYPLVGHQAPDFTVTLWNGQSGQQLHLADLKGKVVVLNFWASWCDTCTVEAPALESAYKQYSAQGVVVVGLAYGSDTPQAGKAFLQQYGVTYPAGQDVDGTVSVAYGVTGVPETVFIGRDGRIASKMLSWSGTGELQSNIQSTLKQG